MVGSILRLAGWIECGICLALLTSACSPRATAGYVPPADLEAQVVSDLGLPELGPTFEADLAPIPSMIGDLSELPDLVPPCGNPNQPCCAGGSCSPTLAQCSAGLCVACGMPFSACCPNHLCQDQRDTCINVTMGAGVCARCGKQGEACCPGAVCATGLACDATQMCN